MDAQATFFATLIDEWVRCGITDAVVCPGNRSTILSALLEDDDRINVHVVVDERSASFFALGLGIATGRPALFWCTSGTAAAEAHAAVIEANHARVPLLVCTANRPPELHHSRDWQSIDQSRLFEGATRWHFEPGVASADMRASWRSIAARAVNETIHHPTGPGPVHLDLAIREPWTLDVGDLPQGRANNAPWHATHRGISSAPSGLVGRLAQFARGAFVVGEGLVDPRAVNMAAEALGWPVLAEARSYSRIDRPNTVTAYDTFLRNIDLAPDVIVRIGSAPISKAVPAWAARSGAEQWFIDPFDVWTGAADESHNIIRADAGAVCGALADAATAPNLEWIAQWQHIEATTQAHFDKVLAAQTAITEPFVARTLAKELPIGANLFAATSMPVRDVEAFSSKNQQPWVYANRGASGMDGLTSTAAGIASATDKPTVFLVGDLSFLYDLNAMWALNGTASQINMTIVIVDNNGGGIFSTLPQLQGISQVTFERVVAAPQNVDIPAIVEAFGIKCERVTRPADFMPAVSSALSAGSIRVVYVKTDRTTNAKLHEALRTS